MSVDKITIRTNNDTKYMLSQDTAWLLQEKYKGEETPAFFADCERLAAGEPLAFVIGLIPFLHTTIYLDSRPLIPRVETEFWVERALQEIKESELQQPRIIDLCAGSGCIGVAIGKAIPSAVIHFAELQEEHHSTILKNIRANGLTEENTAVFGGDLFENALPPYDFILANPPYIVDNSPHVQKSVTDFEPAVALYGGGDGLDIIRRILTALPTQLSLNGIAFIEHEPEQESLLLTHAESCGLSVQTHRDQYNVSRYSRVHMAQ
jgi:release factor glutamine methyltransferase